MNLINSFVVSFKAYDLDGNGFITKDELTLMFKQVYTQSQQTCEGKADRLMDTGLDVWI